MRAALLTAARVALLGGATVLAFFAGGYFNGPRAWAGAIAWALVAVAVLLDRRSLPRSRASRLAIGALALLAAWTLASIAWAPIAGGAYDAGQIVVLYLGAVLAAVVLLRRPAPQRWVEPVLAGGVLIVIGYGIAGRLLPGVLHYARSVSAQGRLEQPLTYWNAMGELAALGFVLAVRVAGDATRGVALRVGGAAAAVPLGLGVYLSFSRGALFACIAGLVALVVAAPRRAQARATVLGVIAAAACAAAAAPLHGVTSLAGSSGTREWQGAVMFAVLVVIMSAAGIVQHLIVTRDRGESATLRLPRRAPWIAVALICAGLAVAIVVGSKEATQAPLSGGASRLVSLQSNRYAYWRVALRAFGAEPIRGVGAGGWSVWWLRYRTINEFAQDAHSLELQTLAELGLVGAALLLALFAGVALAAKAAYRVAPAAAAGPIAAAVCYLAHSPLDWDWQMPAVTLVAVVLAGMLIALGEPAGRPSASGPG